MTYTKEQIQAIQQFEAEMDALRKEKKNKNVRLAYGGRQDV